jgi:cyclopropane fatty-acyl-phospholipid synthase-like methyltransferase
MEKDSERLKEGIKELNESGQTQKSPHLTTDYETIDRKFDYIWSYQVFIHLTDEILHDTLSIIDHFLKETGVCYVTANVGKRNQGKWKEYPLVFRPLDFYKKSAAHHNLGIDTVDDFKHSAHRNQMLKIYKSKSR